MEGRRPLRPRLRCRLYAPADRWSFGFSLLNLGPSKAFVSEKDPSPATARAGAAYRVSQVLVAVDSTAGRDKIFRQSAGLAGGTTTGATSSGGTGPMGGSGGTTSGG